MNPKSTVSATDYRRETIMGVIREDWPLFVLGACFGGMIVNLVWTLAT